MRTAFLVASITVALSSTAFAQSLSGNQIRETLIGNTLTGVADGESYSEHLNSDGTISGWSPSGRYSGKWRISGNEICFSYEESKRAGKWDCTEVKLQGSRITYDDKTTANLKGAHGNGMALQILAREPKAGRVNLSDDRISPATR